MVTEGTIGMMRLCTICFRIWHERLVNSYLLGVYPLFEERRWVSSKFQVLYQNSVAFVISWSKQLQVLPLSTVFRINVEIVLGPTG